jgi:ENTS family enterobactin (siderophore) exporter
MVRLRHVVMDVGPLRDSRAFRVVFAARTVSVFGLGFALVALPLQVYALTGSSVAVALVSAVNGVSVFCGTLVGGVLADRLPRRALIVSGRAAAAVAFTGLALNALWPTPAALAVVCACAALNGFVGTFSTVALQAAVPGLVPADRLPAAGALLALTGQLGSVAAPALSGVVVALWGFPAVYAVTAAVSAAATGLVCLLPRLDPGAEGRRPVLAAAAEGLRFAARDRVVGPLLLLGFVQLLLAAPYVLIPEIVDRGLGGGEAMAGLLYSAAAAGAVCASLTSGWCGGVRRAGAALLAAVAACGAASAAFGAAPGAAAALVALAALGFAETIEEILRFTVLQGHTPDAVRGRVTSVWTAQNTVGGALGAMTLGVLAPFIGAGAAIVAGGGAAVASVAAIAALAPGLRRAGTAAGTAPTGANAG